ncbi:MAG TPA: hypothetical protein VFV38_49710 [Ktedonobacteraceae bacterium]|nr:hypothetical protein [Ktedonobacteraceae bacterium]
MPERIVYRKQLLLVIEAFLKRTPASRAEALHLLQPCRVALRKDAQEMTVDQVIWHPLVDALADANYYENEPFLRKTRDVLLGCSSQHLAKTILSDDFRSSLTSTEAEWYTQLVDLANFLTTVPFTSIHEATSQARQERLSWEGMRASLPELLQAEQAEQEYQQRKARIEMLAASHPLPEQFGEEKISCLAMREVTGILTSLRVGKAAVFFGFPILEGGYTSYGDASNDMVFEMTEALYWAKRVLEAFAGKGHLFLSWRTSNASTCDADALLVCFHEVWALARGEPCFPKGL